jgi:hypothetical protein
LAHTSKCEIATAGGVEAERDSLKRRQRLLGIGVLVWPERKFRNSKLPTHYLVYHTILGVNKSPRNRWGCQRTSVEGVSQVWVPGHSMKGPMQCCSPGGSVGCPRTRWTVGIAQEWLRSLFALPASLQSPGMAFWQGFCHGMVFCSCGSLGLHAGSTLNLCNDLPSPCLRYVIETTRLRHFAVRLLGREPRGCHGNNALQMGGEEWLWRKHGEGLAEAWRTYGE